MTLPLDALRELYRHMEWADATVWRALLAHPPAARDDRLRNLLLHLHTVQRAFLDVWTGQPLAFPNRDDFPDVAAVQRWSQPTYAAAHRFLQSLDPDALGRPVILPWSAQLTAKFGRVPETPTLAETIFQVTSHSTYHRGQVNARLREIGGEPPLVDYIAWIWFGRPLFDPQEVA
jgi:uncharacterized damage-inducible protein DinB